MPNNNQPNPRFLPLTTLYCMSLDVDMLHIDHIIVIKLGQVSKIINTYTNRESYR